MESYNPNLLLTPSKKPSSLKREYPFPIITSGWDSKEVDPNWKCIVGHLEDNFVLVHDEESMKMLYTMGYFGKGTLSKYAPEVCSKKRKTNNDKEKKITKPAAESSKKSPKEDVINVDDSDDESSVPKKEKEIEIVMSESSSSESDCAAVEEKDLSTDIKESLQLTFVEAYFLSYGLGCLVVKDKDQLLNLARLWQKFCELTPDDSFPIMYTAYHHFRSKGWIVKNGIKYGADYILYKDGPPFYHATYSVIVKPVKEQNLREVRGNKQFTWVSLAALNRLNSTAGKGLMFLYVIKPSTISENKVLTPFCVTQFKLEEVLFKRWVASENREENG